MTLADQNMLASGFGALGKGKPLSAAAVPFVPQDPTAESPTQGFDQPRMAKGMPLGRQGGGRRREHPQAAFTAMVLHGNKCRNTLQRIEDELRMFRELGARRRLRQRMELDNIGGTLMALTENVDALTGERAAPITSPTMTLRTGLASSAHTPATTVSLASQDKSLPRDSLERDLGLPEEMHSDPGELFLQLSASGGASPAEEERVDEQVHDLSALLGGLRHVV
eukprot:TRINITY_DN13455_c0_g1_i1.p1 TRINITY_DN13455_c0_g1~~TRINITY_DN13455_c0_g1_i1.p1  ORF type:complete len:224 (+),score=57.00 TRINITY_DN13455_c0_g1_i1:74-745(+)